jgi:SAM-dependent methyltransferase
MNRVTDQLSKSYNQNVKEREHNIIEEWKVAELEKFIRFSKVGGRTLDLGSSNGLYGSYLQDRGYKLKCIDISEEMILLSRSKNLDTEYMEINNLKFEPESFDNIWSLNTILHIPSSEINKTLESISNILSKDGIFYLGSYGGKRFEGIYENDRYTPKRFFSFYTDQQLISIVEKYFKIINFESREVPKRIMKFQSMILRRLS